MTTAPEILALEQLRRLCLGLDRLQAATAAAKRGIVIMEHILPDR